MTVALRKDDAQDIDERDGWAVVLSALEIAHSEVELCIVALEGVMANGGPDSVQFGAVRLRLAQENLGRTQIARQVCGELIRIVPQRFAAELRDLQRREVAHSQAISRHIRIWSPQEVKDDWRGYRAATREILAQARELVRAEKKLLLPLLRQVG